MLKVVKNSRRICYQCKRKVNLLPRRKYTNVDGTLDHVDPSKLQNKNLTQLQKQAQEFFKLYGDCIITAKNEPTLTNAACQTMNQILERFVIEINRLDGTFDRIKLEPNFEKLEVINSIEPHNYDKKREIVGIKTLLLLMKIVNNPSKKDDYEKDFTEYMTKMDL